MKRTAIRSLFVIFTAVALVGFLPVNSHAETRLNRVKRQLKDYKNLRGKILSDMNKLSTSQKSQLKTSLPPATRNGLEDSDDDGVPNILENNEGTNECDASSHDDGMEVELRGQIAAVVPGLSFVIGAANFVVDGNTEYEGAPGNDSGLIVGACVKAEGRTIEASTDLYAKEVKYLDPSRCTGGEDDD